MKERARLRTVAVATLLAAGLTATLVAADDKTLIVVLDAVPYDTMVRLTTSGADGREPLFPGFGPPQPLISSFPSTTSVALAGIFGGTGLEQSPGYEARFFDWQEGRRRGGGPFSYFKLTFPWREFFDWNRKGPLRNALHAARPVRAGVREIGMAMAAFRASREQVFTVYVADTDTAGHLFGPSGLDPILRELDRQLRGLDSERVILLSDHGLAGGRPLVNVLPAVERRIKNGRWRWSQRLERPGDVVLTPYGLVSSFEAYVEPEMAIEVAGALAGVDGVELCVTPKPSGWSVFTATSRLDFERRDGASGTQWRWSTTGEGGPLATLLTDIGSGDWVADVELLEATRASAYPDPLYRLAAAFGAVDNPASVLCSVASGHMFGARGTQRSAKWTKGRLEWTHGALRGDASLGFLMSNRATPSVPMTVRFDRAFDLAFESNVPLRTSE